MNKKKIRDILGVITSIMFVWLYIPHISIYLLRKEKYLIDSDLDRLKEQINVKVPRFISLMFFLQKSSYFRSLFYHRIGPILSLFVGWYRPGNKYFLLSYTSRIGKGFCFFHPYSTIINAESIGENFSCLHCTTVGAKGKMRPIIGNNVTLGCNVCVIGGIHIGNNVIIGAGSVVVKDVPDNCIVAGNPARIIKCFD